MKEKTIGQVLQVAREELSFSLGDAQSDLKIQRRYLIALENDDFDDIPGSTQARQLLAKYADYLDLEVGVILEAFDNDHALLVYEIDAEARRRSSSQRRSRSKRKPSYLPLVYLLAISLTIIAFILYTVWKYNDNKSGQRRDSSTAYSVDVVESSSSSESSSISAATPSTTASSSQPTTSLAIISGDVNHLVVDVTSANSSVDLNLSVTTATSWISLSGTDLAGGVTLSPENPSVTISVDKTNVPTTLLTLGVVEGVTVKIGDQTLDLSRLTEPSATVTLQFK